MLSNTDSIFKLRYTPIAVKSQYKSIQNVLSTEKFISQSYQSWIKNIYFDIK